MLGTGRPPPGRPDSQNNPVRNRFDNSNRPVTLSGPGLPETLALIDEELALERGFLADGRPAPNNPVQNYFGTGPQSVSTFGSGPQAVSQLSGSGLPRALALFGSELANLALVDPELARAIERELLSGGRPAHGPTEYYPHRQMGYGRGSYGKHSALSQECCLLQAPVSSHLCIRELPAQPVAVLDCSVNSHYWDSSTHYRGLSMHRQWLAFQLSYTSALVPFDSHQQCKTLCCLRLLTAHLVHVIRNRLLSPAHIVQ